MPILRLIYILIMFAVFRIHAFERLGPTFIKLGQTLSTRTDLVGEENAEILGKLRDNIAPFSSSIALGIITEELGDVFDAIEVEPVAAASIAQVHRATLKDGKAVAIKILRPNIAKRFRRDIHMLLWFSKMGERLIPRLRRLKPTEVIRLFERTVAMELDLRLEAAGASELAENMIGEANFHVPAINWNLTTDRVMVMEWVDGIKLSDVAALRAAGHDMDKILTNLSEVFFMQAFRDGFFHADPHPGNLFVDQNSRIVAVDFGIMGRMDWRTRLYVAEIFDGFLKEDFYRVAKAHFDAGYVPQHHSVEEFASACRALAMPILNKPANEVSIGKLLGQLFKVTEAFDMPTRPELLLFQKNLVVVEGVGRMINPSTNMWELAREPIEQWARENFSLKGKAKFAFAHLQEVAELLPLLLKKLEDELKNK